MRVSSVTPSLSPVSPRSTAPKAAAAPAPTPGPAPSAAPSTAINLPDVSAATEWTPNSTGLSGTAANGQV
ncbi:MAG TPA: hypothetical protein V6D47_11240, partial [Oscillatoriaceae cyanobacterium]